METVWMMESADPVIAEKLGRELSLRPLVARILVARGLTDIDKAFSFLRPELSDLEDPFLFADMEKAVERLEKAVHKNEKILIYGDYDVDGITATALLQEVLQARGAQVSCYLPHRLREGYGLHKDPLRQAHKEDVGLVLTVDCGTNCYSEVEYARALGIDVVVTDHHPVEKSVRPLKVAAHINPMLPGSSYPFRELAGVGVAFKLAEAIICGRSGNAKMGELEDYLDLVALGTVADVAPLQGENRVLTAAGLAKLREAKRPGLQELCAVARLEPERLNVGAIGFGLAPRLNAGGRMGSAHTGLDLLVTGETARAQELARKLEQENRGRRRIQEKILAKALKKLESLPELGRIIVVWDPEWHPGVLGIVASRLVDRYNRPVIVLSGDGEKVRGSGRSIPGFNLAQALDECQDLLLSHGGHARAVGLTTNSRSRDLSSCRRG